MKILLAKKLGTLQTFNEPGIAYPVTALQVGPCYVSQIKTLEHDGTNSVQIAFGEKKRKSLNKPQTGHLKKANIDTAKWLREFKSDKLGDFKLGQKLTIDLFSNTKQVDITGTTKGCGFTGVVKRWGFHGGPATHGQSDRERAPGSLGRQHSISQGVHPGKKMAGHHGAQRKTILNLKVVKIIPEHNVMLVKGAVPGYSESLLIVRESIKTKKKT
jgi:large subunit ribosomal protein L3